MDSDKNQGSSPNAPQLLFLSHAGADTEAARELAARIEASPEARERGLRVWFDKKDLEPGKEWQAQLEKALERDSTAFAVYVGSRGVINWVESEVRVALSRARSDPNYLFMPILSRQCSGSAALPAFARQYQGVSDVENDPAQFAQLIRAATGQDRRVAVRLVDEPFLGLRAFEEKDTHLFFGRDEDVHELVNRLKQSRLLMVVGDSGSGKSSLVKAGLIPKFRGGALAERRDPRADTNIWHVVETRPRSNPFDSLADSVAAAARAIGRNQDDIRTLRRMVRGQKPQEVADALGDGAPENARILLVVDQFEELFTLSDKIFRLPYVEALLHLAKQDSPAEFRVVLTMRRDYYNLCYEYSELYGWIEDRQRGAKFSVRRMSDDQLRSCIEKPLALTDVGDTGVFVDRVLADVGDQPGELALLEMALTESWRRRSASKGDMLQAYASIGGTAGALANVADEVFDEKLDDVEKGLAEASLIRLVRLGETGGTTRRVATRDEFSEDAWGVLQKLARQDYGRLIYIGGQSELERAASDMDQLVEGNATESRARSLRDGHSQQSADTAELSHEALVSQWPRYQEWLQASPNLKRVHDGLMTVAKSWATATRKKSEELLTGNRLAEAIPLMNIHPSWLSEQERAFLNASRARATRRSFVEKGAVALLAVLTVVAVWFGYNRQQAENRAREQLVRNYWIQGIGARDSNDDPLKAAHYFARAAAETFDSIGERNARIAAESLLTFTLSTVIAHKGTAGPFGGVLGAVFSQDERRVLTWSADSTARVWDSRTGKPVTVPLQHKRYVGGAVFNKDETRVLTWSADGTARVWDSQTGKPVTVPLQHKGDVLGAVFSQDETRVLTWSQDNTARLWSLAIDEWPKKHYPLKIEVETGTRLNTLGGLEVVPASEWQAMKDEYDQIAARVRRPN